MLVVSPGYVRTNLSLNAVAADGTTHGQMDENTAKGVSPLSVARRVLDGIVREEKEVIAAKGTFRLAVVLRNLVPDLLFSVLGKRAAREVATLAKNV